MCAMSHEYKHNHYVPEWYQKRFLPEGQRKQWYLDLRPDRVTSNGHTYTRRALLDLSRFGAAPSARLGHFPFECDWAFPAQC